MTNYTTCVACIDIGGTKALVGLVDQAGNILARDRYLLGAARDPEATAANLAARCRHLAEEAGLTWEGIEGVGCSTAGMLDSQSGLIFSAPNLFGPRRDVPFQAMLQAAFERPALIEMDAQAAALGEGWRGAGAGVDFFVYVVVGTGIGAGILVQGQLYRGWRGTAGEVGHTTIEPDGPLCNCGNYGCLEVLAAGPAIAQHALAVIRQGRQTMLRELAAGRELDAGLVIQAARLGDEAAREIVERTATYLGIGLANLLNILNPEVIALGGGVIRGNTDLLLEPIRRAAKSRCSTWIDWERTRLVPALLGEEAALLGAARLVWARVE